ncbi:hypothetical protein GINT2_000533 [Glugoides intestinalis]
MKENTFPFACPIAPLNKCENIELFEIPIKADHFAVYKDMILICSDCKVKIYKFDSAMNLSMIKSYEMCFLFLLGYHLKKDALCLAYRIFLNLISNKVSFKNAEAYICTLLDQMRFDRIVSVKFNTTGIIINYVDGNKMICNYLLNSIGLEAGSQFIDGNNESQLIKIKKGKGSVEIKINKESVFKKSIEKLVHAEYFWNSVFLLTKSSLLVLKIN